MSKTIRIKTTPGGDDKYVSVYLKQNFNQLNVLSLTITKEDAYRSFESNYGVVAGRVDINDGFGLKNAKVSIFIPLSEGDANNEVIKEIYPYTSFGDKNSNGVRYNLLPNQQQNENHTPVGTFPSKRQILDNPTMVEVYDKYYKFTTTTNESGDYMFFGVPVGEQRIFFDIDVSDIGFLSARPYELIEKGVPKEDFEDRFAFKSKSDLDKLPQIISKNEIIEVLPFWTDDLEGDKSVGVTRFDYSVTEYELTPTALFMGSLFSDNNNDSLSKNCRPRKKMGQMNNLITGAGKIEAITRTSNGAIVKSKEMPTDAIDENGNWAFEVPMNLRKLVTDEFGALVPSPDGKKGVFSEGDYRFRISMGEDNGIKKKDVRAKMLVPNMTNNYEFDTFTPKELKDAQEIGNPIYKVNKQLSFFNEDDDSETDPTIQYNYLEDFFTFRWKKIYTVRQYIPRYQPNPNEGPSQRNFIGFKEILNGDGVNKIPYNRLFTKPNQLYSILCYILTVYGFIIGFVNSLIQFLNSIISNMCELRIPFFCLNSGFENAGGRTVKSNAIGRYQVYNGHSAWGGYKDCSKQTGFVSGGYCEYYIPTGDHVLGASQESLTLSTKEADMLKKYWDVGLWANGWAGIFSFFKRDSDEKGTANDKRSRQQNWIHNPDATSVKPEKKDDDIDMNDCGRPSDWVRENMGASGGYAECWTFRGDIPSKRRIRNCVGYSLYFESYIRDDNEGYLIRQSPWSSNKGPGNKRRWWRHDTGSTMVSDPPDYNSATDDSKTDWNLTNTWYSSKTCAKYQSQSGVGCWRFNAGYANNGIVNREWWKDNIETKKCDKPECKKGIRILGICISFNPELTRINPIKGLCNKCTNDDEVDPEAANNGKGPNNDGDGYGVNKKCCNGCDDCDDHGSLIYYNKKAEDENRRVKGAPNNCLNGVCCEKIAPIGLKCAEEGSISQPALFATGTCGREDVIRRCKTCTGVYWYGISDWVECSLEGLARLLGMVNLEFYNDWINGSLYFPLVKRNLKIRKRRKGKGQVQKDVFCDYDCDGSGSGPDYQTDTKQRVYSVKLRGGGKLKDYDFEGCVVDIPKRLSGKNWYENPYIARKTIEFNGFTDGDITKPCSFTLDDYCIAGNECKDGTKLKNTNKKIIIKSKQVEQHHGKPKYLKTSIDTDGDGEDDTEIWHNFGGHGHHKNKCKKNYIVERKEYLKSNLTDCQTKNKDAKEDESDNPPISVNVDEIVDADVVKTTYVEEVTIEEDEYEDVKHNLGTTDITVKFETWDNGAYKDITSWTNSLTWRVETKNKIEVTWTGSYTIILRVTVTHINEACKLPCAVQGTAACTSRDGCNCKDIDSYNYEVPTYRGLIKEHENEIYYTSTIEENDTSFNSNYYKKNIMFPTNITELGSSVKCDIDEAPFIIDDLESTSYKLSEEDLKSKGGRGTEDSPFKLKERESVINIGAYVDFGCNGVRCMNVRGSLTASQIGSELHDLNDTGLECNTCSIYSDVNTDLRGYFCRRFSTFTPTVVGDSILDMKVNYVRSGGVQGENYYEPYGLISPKCRSEFDGKVGKYVGESETEEVGENFIIDNDLNDGDDLTPGDKCGYNGADSLRDVKYFYGMEASSFPKNNLKEYPFSGSKLGNDSSDSASILVKDDEGINPTSTQTPYFFYFGLVPGKTALDKVTAYYFADIINKENIADITKDDDGSGDSGNGTDPNDPDEAINALIGSCLKN